MATRIIVTDTKYFRELTNAQDFATNTGDFSDHLLGHVGDRQKAEFTIQVSNSWTMGRYDIVGGDTIQLKDNQSFLSEDFYTGGKAYLSIVASGGLNYEFDIQNISADGSILTATNIIEQDNGGAPTGPTVLPNGSYGSSTNDVLRSLDKSNGLVARFGFVPNGGNVSFVSPLDQITQAYKFDGLRPGGAPGPIVSGSWDSAVNGSDTGNMTAQFIQTVTDNGVIKVAANVAAIDSIQEFKVVQEFILPYYLQGDFDNVQDQTPTEWIEDGLRQVFEFEFRKNLSNPNVSQFGEYNTVLGNVRWYNDNYIDSVQQYSVSNVVLTDTATGQTINEINASSTTRVTASILSADSTFLTTDPVLIEHSYLPNSSQYANQSDVFTDVWLRETLRNTVDAVAADGTIITGFTAVLIGAGQIDIQFDITFTTGQQTRIQEGYNYELSIKVADSSLTVPFSDVTKLIIQADQYTLNTDITGLATFPQSYIYTRPMMYPIVDPLDRFSNLRGWIQDGFLYDWTLNLDLVEEATLEALTLRLVAFNTLENTYFELDNYNYDLSGQVVTVGPPDVQNITIDNTRGYDLADGDKLNFAKLQTGTYSAPNQPYTGQTAFRLSWQDWIQLPNADTVFYNPAEPNNGLNKNSSHYSLQNNYVICVLIDARIGKVVDGTNVITQYVNRSANLEVYDFGEQDGSPITWAGVIQTFDDQGADLGGALLTEGLTTIKGTYDGDVPVVDPSLYWGEVRLERLNNPGDNYYSLSTLEAAKDSSPLQAPTGSTYAKIELIGGDVVVSADLNPDLLPDAGPWNPSVRMGLIDQSVPVVPTVKIQIDGNTRQVDGYYFDFQQTEIMSAATVKTGLFTTIDANWVFKGSPSNVQPPDWSIITPFADINALISFLGSNSDRWIYTENTDTTKIDEGLIIEFERPAGVQPTSEIITTFANGGIDQDKIFYFDKNIIVNSLTLSVGDSDIYYAIREDSADVEDWTDFTLFSIGGLVGLNADLAAITDGDKYGLHFYVISQSIDGATLTMNFDYDSLEDSAKTISVSQSDVNPEYRTDLVDCVNWLPSSNTKYAITDVTDTALLSKLDYTNAITVVGWYEQRTSLASSNVFPILTPPQAGTGSSDAGGIGFYTRHNGTRVQINASGQTNGGSVSNRKTLFWNLSDFQGGLASAHRTMVVFTYDGANTNVEDDWEAYVNGQKLPQAMKDVFADGTFSGAVEPSGGVYWHARLQNTDGNPNKSERVEIYDGVMTPENIRKLFNEPDAGRNGDVPNIFRSWDFGNASGATVPETEASKDMTLNTIIAPSSFY